MDNAEEGAPLLRRRGPTPAADQGEERESDGAVLSLRIKVSDGRELRCSANAGDTVLQLKRVVARVANAEGKFLRLIASGRMLTPDDARLVSFKVVTDNSFIHCVISNAPPPRALLAGPPLPSVDPNADDDDDSSDDEDGEGRRERRGFDRLRDAGMTRSEVAALRGYFAPQVRRHMASAPALGTAANSGGGSSSDDDAEAGSAGGRSIGARSSSAEPRNSDEEAEAQRERMLQAEEDWMAAQGEASEFAVNSRRRASDALLLGGDGVAAFRLGALGGIDDSGSDVGGTRDFLFGLVMGFFLGFIMLFWLWEGAVPQRQKLGIMAGVLIQLGLNCVRRAWQDEAAG